MLSVIIPAYNEEKMIAMTTAAVHKVLDGAGIEHELLFVNDGSKDKTWELIESISAQDDRVRGICFSRNFGKEAAISAGLAGFRGSCCVVMDCDLQDPPETIPEMYNLWEQGFQIVEGVKRSRGAEKASYGLMSRLFNQMMSASTGTDFSKASDFKLIDRKVADVILSYREKCLFFRAVSSMVGFKKTQVEFDVQERAAGSTKWSKKSLYNYAIVNITSYTAAPMKIIIGLGIIMFLLALIFGLDALISYFSGRALWGFTTIVMLLLIIGSMIMMSLGIIGYYLTRVFDEVRIRPRYIISTEAGKDDTEKEKA